MPVLAFLLLLALPVLAKNSDNTVLFDGVVPAIKSEEFDTNFAPSQTYTRERFDCVDNFIECGSLWSNEQKEWCIEKEDVHCPGYIEGVVAVKPRVHVHPVGVGIAWMLLGSVAFIMALFYLVNWPDSDIRRYAWNIISTTISIFTAVLVFHGICDIITEPLAENWPIFLLSVHFIIFLVWFALLNLRIAVDSGANFEGGSVDLSREVWIIADTMRDDYGTEVPDAYIREPVGQKTIAILQGAEVFVRRGKLLREQRECMMKCWAILLAHMTGFAAINMGSALQHLPAFRKTPLMTAVALLINQLFLTALFWVAKEVRKCTAALDGVKDERDELYDEYAEEAENDAAGLSVSFLTAQAMRFWISGTLPNHEGEEWPGLTHSMGSVFSLYGAGLMAGVAGMLLPFVLPPMVSGKENQCIRRFVDMLQNQGLMLFAWCVYWATRWEAVRSRSLDGIGGPQTMAGRIILGLLLSTFAMLAIFGLDKIEDAARARSSSDHQRVSRVTQSIINALGILVGFSWENSFRGAVAAVASLTTNNATTKFLLAGSVALVIIPAWRQYVLEKVMIYRRMLAEDASLRSQPWHRAHALSPSNYQQVELEDQT